MDINSSIVEQYTIFGASFNPYVMSKPTTIEPGGTYKGKLLFNFKREGCTVAGVVSDKHLDLFVQTMYLNKKIEALLLRQMNKPLSIRPKRQAVQLLWILYHITQKMTLQTFRIVM